MKRILLAAACLGGLVSGRVLAADAQHPYSNIDHRVDAGNNTGDSEVEALNAAQLNGARIPGAVLRPRRVPGVATIYPRNGVMPPYPPPGGYTPAPPPYGWPPPYPYPY